MQENLFPTQAFETFLQARENRLHRRLPTSGRGKIVEAYDGLDSVAFIDVHSHGARLEGLFERTKGAPVLLQCGPVTRAARIIWSRKTEFGIAFCEPLSESEVQFLSETPSDIAPHYIFDLSDY